MAHIECNTASLPIRDRMDVWSDRLARAFGPIHIQTGGGIELFGDLQCTIRDQFRFNTLRYHGQNMHRTSGNVAHLETEYFALTKPLSGTLDVQQSGMQHALKAGNIYLFNHATPYYAAPRNEYATTSIVLPVSALRQRGVRPEQFYALSTGSAHGSLLSVFLDRLTSSFLQWTDHEFSVLTEQFLDLVALFFVSSQATVSSQESSIRAAHLVQVRSHIKANCGDPELNPTAVAAACRISVSYLHALFRSTGASVEEYIFAERLEHARNLLAAPHCRHYSIATIAYMSGFSHPAHFSRTFKQRFGCSPRDCRQSGR